MREKWENRMKLLYRIVWKLRIFNTVKGNARFFVGVCCGIKK
jgi:hypothetical protein